MVRLRSFDRVRCAGWTMFAFGRGEAARCASSRGHSGYRYEYINAVSEKEVFR